MTPNKENKKQLDAILAAFSDECPEPSPAQIAEWRQRYPQFAADIMNLAADIYALANLRKDQSKEQTLESARRNDEAALESFRKKRQRLEQRRNGTTAGRHKTGGL